MAAGFSWEANALQHRRTLHRVIMGVALKATSQLWHALGESYNHATG